MNGLWLLTANFKRKPLRASLTTISLVVAFLLFMILRALADSLAGGAESGDDERLVVDARYSMTDNLPIAHIHAMSGLEEVAAVSPMVWFGGYYQDPQQSFTTFVVDHQGYLDVFREIEVEPAAREQFRASRRSVLVHESLLATHGWAVGQTIPLVGDIWPKEDGSWDWEFVLAGSYQLPEGSRVPRAFLLRLDYFREAVSPWVKDQVGWAVLRLKPGADAAGVAKIIDARFLNSSDPTKTMTEDAYGEQMANQIGDLGLVAGMILAAVFFTIVLLTANVISLGYRERITELATMKTLGFRDGSISMLVFTESVLLCLLGATIGIALGFAVEPVFQSSLAQVLGGFQMTVWHAVQGLVLAIVLGAAVGLVPALKAWRLPIARSLREVG